MIRSWMVLVFVGFSFCAFGQSTPADYEQFVAYWTAEPGWHSDLQLRNNLPDQDLTVSPTLRTADGAETSLPPVTIKPQQVKSVDIGVSAPQLAGKYGSVRLHFRAIASRSLYASLMIGEMGHPIAFHIDGAELPEKFEGVSREGIWWLPNETAADYLIVTNLSTATIRYQLSLYDAAGKEFKQALSVGPRQTSRLSVRQIIRSSGVSGRHGGIKIQAGLHAASLDSLYSHFRRTSRIFCSVKDVRL
jgi:hypothetical protein